MRVTLTGSPFPATLYAELKGGCRMRLADRVSYLALELTGRCQLRCVHCYADSSPLGGHGTMTADDWRRVIDGAVHHGLQMVQFIGGEPSLHPSFAVLVRYALDAGLRVGVFTNLLHVGENLWRLYETPDVALQISYYSADTHDAVTGRAGSHARTRANLAEAIRRGIPVQVCVVDMGQRLDLVRADLESLGARDIKVDRERRLGRSDQGTSPDVTQLCGHCGEGVAIGPDGDVWPCVMARWLPVGNVRHDPVGTVLTGEAMANALAGLVNSSASGPRCLPIEGGTCTPRTGLS
ncbi:MoaA/NifB/PqqE/SkfB family radical SAM enzyme [Kibdelosporangium banguiense]|uniref:MoaA/NifB/PqqE/SkfB family radical SAM enzyme n=1 Tax=Kibdelosporangium banguiense TaxID=1365924 RepID=A0ABS4TL69_9PSEU|nr:radical SAM protein [Kibdelosporangium banguiense]MBP2325173.1 MoaA/NifB/PqqE/SkfB family radical SAM enzyme [Kibdelosporangium banguiense]